MKVYARSAARDDILRQYRYYLIEKDTALVAERFLDAVEAAFDAVSSHPLMGTPKLLENPLLAGLRSWPVPGFKAVRIYHIHSGNQVRILRVLHGKRDVNALLEDESAAGEE